MVPALLASRCFSASLHSLEELSCLGTFDILVIFRQSGSSLLSYFRVDDENLVDTLRRARQSDPAAVEDLIVHYESMVRSECKSYSLKSSELSASDLYQESLVRIWTQLDKFSGNEHEQTCRLMFQKWLRTTTRNVIANLLGGNVPRRYRAKWSASLLNGDRALWSRHETPVNSSLDWSRQSIWATVRDLTTRNGQ
jgi:DNA-directed RNA polymerase specialized sigma24 family protein